jgi:hypothetical protein
LISKKREATAVILSVEDYLRNIVKQPDGLTKLQKQAKKAGTDKLSLEDIDAEMKTFRKGPWPMLKVVFDTNVVVSAALYVKSLPTLLLSLGLEDKIRFSFLGRF